MVQTEWNYADLLEAVAGSVPEWIAQIHDGTTYTWQQFNARSNGLATDLLAAGLAEQSKIAVYLYNGPQYLEAYFGAFKVGMVPVNTNYRYGREEIAYLFSNSDAEAVVVDSNFLPIVEAVRASLPLVKRWYVVGAGPEQLPDWATDYESVVAEGESGTVAAPWGRSGDQLLLLYTGGTTGMPKGVMWRQDDLFNVLGSGGNAVLGIAPVSSLDDVKKRFSLAATNGVTGGPRVLPACPLMHGTGQFSALIALMLGGAIVTVPNRSFDATYLFDVIEREAVNTCVIVGEAFAKPMLAALDANPQRWNLSALSSISSSGVMWSQETKAALIEHLPHILLVDSYGSSEAVGLGQSVSSKTGAETTAKFSLGPTVHVFAEDDIAVTPGSDRTGFVAISGFVPLGYYKDRAKTEKTFRVIDGIRYSIPGDFAKVNADGTLHLLGRGSVCINTGGEKVFPEEVEEVLKRHQHIDDAVCVGVPNDRFGEVIVALIEVNAAIDAPAIIAFVQERLATYKAPRHLLTVESIGRSPAGKVDYKRLTSEAVKRLASS